jgi:hypothetical protein
LSYLPLVIVSECGGEEFMERKGFEKVEFITAELKKISEMLEKTGGAIVHVSGMELSDTPKTTVTITLVWAD